MASVCHFKVTHLVRKATFLKLAMKRKATCHYHKSQTFTMSELTNNLENSENDTDDESYNLCICNWGLVSYTNTS